MINGSQLRVLKACDTLAGGQASFIQDTEIAGETGIRLEEVRDCLEILASDELVSVVRLEDDSYQANIEAKGRLFLSQRRRLPGETEEKTPGEPKLIKVVPKGLRSYDAEDKDFFLDLVPGPRRANGLPESIHFWKARIEETDPEKTFAVGVIFGPSGCGKSSLVKAGLLPHLADSVTPIYLESTAQDTEARLLKGLRKHHHDLPANLDLRNSLIAVKEGKVGGSKKTLPVIDQFEQWLRAKRAEQDTELASALRECDGSRLQTLIMVRDDFSMALLRFMRELGIKLVEGQNFDAVDLFDPQHALRVLTAFGRAYGVLSEDPEEISREQKQFLDSAVTGLAQDGRVISVRLALFAEMVKGKAWTLETLKDVGGAEGVGVAFLEETFSARSAPPSHHIHQKAVQSVLKALLPESGSDLKGSMRSCGELLEVSGYASRPKEFDDLIGILDPELRLITPTDPEGLDSEDQPTKPPGEQYYQLTHDYLVDSLRAWLTRKQRETRRGRAELRLAERSALWNAKRENRHLPSFLEWANLRLLTRKKDWTEPQKKMMKRAGRVHGLRTLVLAALMALITWGGYEAYGSFQARALVDSLKTADTAEVPNIVENLSGYYHWARGPLSDLLSSTKEQSSPHLHASLALLPVDPGQVKFLYTRLLNANPSELPVIWKILKENHRAPVERLWKVLEDRTEDDEKRFRAAWALAGEDAPELEPRWDTVSELITNRLLASVHKNFSDYPPLLKMLRPIRKHLLDSLAKIFVDEKKSESERSLATSILADYASDDPDRLADLLMDADLKMFGTLFEVAQKQIAQTVEKLQTEIKKVWKEADSEQQKEGLARRQARAAVLLIRMGRADEDVWCLLRHSADPRLRSYVVNWLRPLGADPKILMAKLEGFDPRTLPTSKDGEQAMDAILFHSETSVRRALIQALGEYEADDLPPEKKVPLVEKLLGAYRTDPDVGIHGAAEWTLRRWGREADLREADSKLKAKDRGDRRWFVNSEGQTLAVIEGPVEFSMGSPPTEPDRLDSETLHRERINRRFAIATKEVTVEQFQRFRQANPKIQHWYTKNYSPDPHGPQISVTWYEAAAYCSWLSQREGLAACYEPNPEGVYAEGMKVVPNFLGCSGYRLPTEAEWEYACRAGVDTSRYYGGSAAVLGQYAWWMWNSVDRAWPCGRLKPNDFGLFDVLGNVFEWCHDPDQGYQPGEGRKATDILSKSEYIKDSIPRFLRGGSFNVQPALVRSAYRGRYQPTNRNFFIGFRPSRTYK